MKYVIGTHHMARYVAVGYDGYLYTPNCMCYRLAKPKYFDTIADAKKAACDLVVADKWERDYWDSHKYEPAYVYEAVIHHCETDYGKPYTTVSAGREVEKIKFNYERG